MWGNIKKALRPKTFYSVNITSTRFKDQAATESRYPGWATAEQIKTGKIGLDRHITNIQKTGRKVKRRFLL